MQMGVFKAPKSSGTNARLVMDAVPLNRISRRSPPMLLPFAPSLLSFATRYEVGVTTDAVSWFYQIPVDSDVSAYFGVAQSRPRGSPALYTMQRLCMGWCWAPTIAQRLSWVLAIAAMEEANTTQECAVIPWVDNFLFLSHSCEAVHQMQREAPRVCFRQRWQD